MTHNDGVVIVAYGSKALAAAAQSVVALRRVNDLPITVIGDAAPNIPGVDYVYSRRRDAGARGNKVRLLEKTTYRNVLYLDADTQVQQDVSIGFEILRDGWDVVITPSEAQGADALWHIKAEERQVTLDELGTWQGGYLQLQAGVFFIRRSIQTRDFMLTWEQEWRRWQDQDQAAFLRALALSPIRVWLLGRPWNGGAVIQHKFGRARD